MGYLSKAFILVWYNYLSWDNSIPCFISMFKAKDNPLYQALGEVNPNAVIFPEFTQAYIGLGVNQKKTVAVYDWNTVVALCVQEHDMKPTEAREFLFLNVISQTNTEDAPIFLQQNPMREIEQFFFM